MNKTTSIRIREDVFDKIRIYSEIENISQNSFINELLVYGMDRYILHRSGGDVLYLQNPQFYPVDKEKAKETFKILSAAAKQINDLQSNVPIPLFGILAFFERRLFHTTPEDEEVFKGNVIFDGIQSKNTYK